MIVEVDSDSFCKSDTGQRPRCSRLEIPGLPGHLEEGRTSAAEVAGDTAFFPKPAWPSESESFFASQPRVLLKAETAGINPTQLIAIPPLLVGAGRGNCPPATVSTLPFCQALEGACRPAILSPVLADTSQCLACLNKHAVNARIRSIGSLIALMIKRACGHNFGVESGPSSRLAADLACAHGLAYFRLATSKMAMCQCAYRRRYECSELSHGRCLQEILSSNTALQSLTLSRGFSLLAFFPLRFSRLPACSCHLTRGLPDV